MPSRFLNNININDEYSFPSADGSADQIITTDGAGQLSFVDQSTINAGNAEHVVIYAKNTSGASISKGTPVYITGTVGATDTVEIAPADASNSAKMPAVGLLDDTLANNAFGYVITGGFMDNITTDPIDGATPSSNDTVYVKSGGGLTLTKPTGASNLIQNIAKVGKVSGGNAGSLIVSSILRTNDVPNLTTGKIWVGDSNTTESTVVHLDETNGRMGINTNSPQVPFEAKYTGTVDEIVRIVGTASGKPQMTFYNDTTLHTKIVAAGNNDFSITNTHSTGDMFFATGGATRLHIESNGRVGIGTTSPTHKLHVNGDAKVGTNLAVGNTFGNKGTNQGINFESPTTALQTARVDADAFRFYFGGTGGGGEVFRILEGGNVGIGTTSPSRKLQVIGTDGAAKFYYNSSFTNSQYSVVDVGMMTSGTAANGFGPKITFRMGGNGYDGYATGNIGTTRNGADNTHNLTFGTSNAGSMTTKMVLTNAGNLGIGTTAPAANRKLHVVGNARVDSTFYLGTDESCAFFRYYNALIITNSASTNITLGGGPGSVNNDVYVGNGFLDVNGYIRGKNYLYLEDANGTLRTTLRSESTYATLDNGSNTLNYNAGNHSFLIGLSEKMRINSSGNVGIGTTSPGEKLEVNGTVKATASTDAYKGYIKQAYNCSPLMKTASSAYNFVPFTSTILTSTADYYNRMVAPYDGRVKKVILKHTGGATPTATNVNFKKHINGVTQSTIYTGTVTGGAAANMQAEYNFNDSDFTFSDGDTIGVLVQGTGIGTTKTLGGMSVQIIVEYNIT